MQRRALSLFNPTIQDMMDVAKLANQANFDSAWNGEFFNQNGLVT
jgi:alkanesulfonate monooxygenase SsuD/methylene tetrahydromethanopterin reductase-like flavin-dependent oxidoreductase (luciferase family)